MTMPPGNLIGGNLVTPGVSSVLTISEIAANLIYPAAGTTLNGKNWGIVTDGPSGGASAAGSTDNTFFLNKAISEVPYGATLLVAGNIYCAGRIVLRSGVKIIIQGDLTVGSIATAMDGSGVNDCRLYVNRLFGDNATVTTTGVLFNNGNGNIIVIDYLYNCLNKGVSLIGNSTRNDIYIGYLAGCAGPTGAGLAMLGANVRNNDVRVRYATGNRIAVTLNGVYDNRIRDGLYEANTITGLAFDGIITGGNDGACRNKVSNIACNGTLGGAYGGFYFGNGSSENECSNISAVGNLSAGMRGSAGVGYEIVGNKFNGVYLQGNSAGGAIFSFAPGTQIDTLESTANSGAAGLQYFTSDGCKLTNFAVSNQISQPGIVIQSANCKLYAGEANGNTTGLTIGAGGSDVFTGNRVSGVDLTGNTTAASIANGSAILHNCPGVGTETFGQSANLKDGSVVSHNLFGTPQWASFEAADPTHIARVASVNGATATLSLKDSAGTPITVNETVRFNFKFNFGV